MLETSMFLSFLLGMQALPSSCAVLQSGLVWIHLLCELCHLCSDVSSGQRKHSSQKLERLMVE